MYSCGYFLTTVNLLRGYISIQHLKMDIILIYVNTQQHQQELNISNKTEIRNTDF